MKFLFETTAFSYNNPVFYRISEISENEYLAEPIEQNRKPFRLHKQSGHWIAEGSSSQHHAEQIGMDIDKHSRFNN